MQKIITKSLILIAVLTVALGTSYLFAAWTGPTQTPPDGNTDAPVHIGTTDQVKDGGLSVNALSVFGGGYFQGSVQIGDSGSSPQDGTIRWTGADFEGYMSGAWVSLTGAGLACTSFTYSGWGTCQSDGTQTRTVTTSTPDGCTGGDPVTIQSCTPMSTQCANIGGSWIDAQNTCYFSGTSCPSGWTPNGDYSSSNSKTCDGRTTCKVLPHGNNNGGYCTTGGHYRHTVPIESCQYAIQVAEYGRTCWPWPPHRTTGTCTATQTEIGCTK